MLPSGWTGASCHRPSPQRRILSLHYAATTCSCDRDEASDSLIHTWMSTGFILCKCCAMDHNCYELMCATATLGIQVNISQFSSLSTALAFFLLPLPWISLNHAWWEADKDNPSTVKHSVSFILSILASYESCINHYLLQKEASLTKSWKQHKSMDTSINI